MRALRVVKRAAQDKVRLKAERRRGRANLPTGFDRALGPARSSPPTSSKPVPGNDSIGLNKKSREGKIQEPAGARSPSGPQRASAFKTFPKQILVWTAACKRSFHFRERNPRQPTAPPLPQHIPHIPPIIPYLPSPPHTGIS